MSQTEQEGRGDTPAKVIEGWTDPALNMHPMNLALSVTIRANARPEDVPATLVIGEKAWPESKVRELVKAIQTGIYRGKFGEGPQHTINRIAKEYGLTL